MVDMIGGAAGARKLRTLREGGFTPAKRQRFLDALALTCNITKAAAFAGIGVTTVHKTRQRDAVFAEAWQEALNMGFDRIEALVLEHGGGGVRLEPDPDRAAAMGADPEPFDFDRGMEVLKYRQSQRRGENRITGRPPRNATRAETNAALMKALAALQRSERAKQP